MYQPILNNQKNAGIGMTSERTRRRLVEQVREMGVSIAVLGVYNS